jgi:hypothetical protein
MVAHHHCIEVYLPRELLTFHKPTFAMFARLFLKYPYFGGKGISETSTLKCDILHYSSVDLLHMTIKK